MEGQHREDRQSDTDQNARIEKKMEEKVDALIDTVKTRIDIGSSVGEMVAEVHGIEIARGQQAQGQDLVTFNGFALGVVIDEAQIFQALAPFGQRRGIQNEAVVPSGLGPAQPLAQIGQEASVKRPPTPFGFLEAVEGVFLGQKQRLKRSVQQLMDGFDMQKHQVGEDKQEVPGAEALAFADTGSGEMTLDTQHGKQFLDPQFQGDAEIFQGRFDLSLKASDLSVMQGKAPFVWYLLVISQS